MASSDSVASTASSPFTFEPYHLTPLDHAVASTHLVFFLRFNLTGKNPSEALHRLDEAISRLISLHPFLSGNVAPAADTPDRVNVFQVQPAGISDLQKTPMLSVQQHTSDRSQWTHNGDPDEEFLPLPIVSPAGPKPVLRFKANLVRDDLVLYIAFAHQAMDGWGMSMIYRTLSQLCRDPNSPIDTLPTIPDIHRQSRQRISDLASSSSPGELRWTSATPSLESNQPDDHDAHGNVIGRVHEFSVGKIKALQEACHSLLCSLPAPWAEQFKDTTLSSTLIVSALLAISGTRSLPQNTSATESSPPSPSPKVMIAADTRAQCGLPPSYTGNAIVPLEVPYKPDLLPHPIPTKPPSSLPGISEEDLHHICTLALSLLTTFKRLNKTYIRGALATMNHTRDWTSYKPAYHGILVSCLRGMEYYENFGPLCDPLEVDIPSHSLPGHFWILPVRSLREPWRVRIILDEDAMGRFAGDGLVRWASTSSSERQSQGSSRL
ncbi:hypothetical protein ASPWEDRAFT_35295 [Aspergillus wentii DTO 134E9]|uniref:Trichothecene 3-O-acetyltransferase-like N-terminal domain-containing protein n=1 Tax=Aspergillus wentii DTO 134E9 TaxID=1073089 RepID=A0A1L9S3G0_ASPWE|nr:uncharacterized protein ASPWEDRAFT_35295 [Aspergillus wentii DTO 134E9]OJJ41692.1 hypothetical protein ASPWEDRAFT_35295 [Aspergillus wentii DTO 134E9]